MIGIAFSGCVIPTVHEIDRLGELSATLLVNTTGVDPNPFVASSFGEVAALLDLDIALTILLLAFSKILQSPPRHPIGGTKLHISEFGYQKIL